MANWILTVYCFLGVVCEGVWRAVKCVVKYFTPAPV